jgi:general secretion pathway protein N
MAVPVILAALAAAPLYELAHAAAQTASSVAAAPAGAAATPLAVHSLDDFAQTRDRPLFSPTRRPPPPPAPPVVAAAPDPEPLPPPEAAPPDLSLYGIVEDAKGGRAIIKPKDGKTMGVRVSDEVEGWKVRAIDNRHLVLALDDRSVTFTLFEKAASDDRPQVVHQHPARVLELNAAGILTARYVRKPHR